jgi:DNA-binding Lrp family transcriptional regulator
MKNENYITIQGWMVNDLKLSGNELNLYALIYGFSQDGKSKFKGAMQYLSESLGISKQSLFELLKKLVKKDLIKKYESGSKGHKKCDYGVNHGKIKKISGDKMIPPSGQESLPLDYFAVKKVDEVSQETLPPSGQESLHHINIHNDLDNNNKFTTAKAVDQKEINLSKPKKDKQELTQEQLTLFHAAKACFELSEKAKAIMYQDKETTGREMKHLKTLVMRCTKIAPDITGGFLENILEHFKILTNGKLKGKAVFTPRSLITPWIWELVIDSLPENESPALKEIARGLFK